MIQLLVNTIDLSDLLLTKPVIGWQFQDSPGSIAYKNLNSVEVYNEPGGEFDPHYRFSPLFGDNLRTKITIGSLTTESGRVTQKTRRTPSVLTLEIRDRIQDILERNVPATIIEGLTPAEIARELLESFGIPVDVDTWALAHNEQDYNGLFYDYQVLTGESGNLDSAISAISVAGDMRSVLYNGKVYFIGNLEKRYWPTALNDPFALHISDFGGLPAERIASRTVYSGGSVTWLAGVETLPAELDSDYGTFSADYSQGSLVLLNPDGAEYLIRRAETPNPILFDISIRRELVEELPPGQIVTIPEGIVGPEAVYARLVAANHTGIIFSGCSVEVITNV